MLKTSIIGNIGKDAEVRQVQSGNSVISFTVCHSESYTKQSGEKVERNVWVECSIWRTPQQGVAVAQYIKKGGKIYCEGEIEARAYINAQGNAIGSLSLNVKHTELLGGGQQQGNYQQQQGSNTGYQQQSPAPAQQQQYQAPAQQQNQQQYQQPGQYQQQQGQPQYTAPAGRVDINQQAPPGGDLPF